LAASFVSSTSGEKIWEASTNRAEIIKIETEHKLCKKNYSNPSKNQIKKHFAFGVLDYRRRFYV
jgi:hypothetical protein